MEKRYKDILRPLVAELRRTLAGAADGSRRGDLDRELERLGIAPDGTIAQTDVVANPTAAERRARAVAAAELGAVAGVTERIAARSAFVERAAYGWINRLLALRVLEARGLIDETLRGNPDYDGLSEALYVLRQSEPQRASGPDGGWWAVIEDACAAQAAALPGLFGLDTPSSASSSALYDAAIALRPSTTALLRCVELLGASPAILATRKGRPEVKTPGQEHEQYPAVETAGPTANPSPAVSTASADYPAVLTAGANSTAGPAAFADPDAIGWAYQFYQEEAKAQVYARLKGGKKVATRDEIAAATQLFTEPYMVKWLLQNSLGRSYHEAYPQSALPATWEYYIRPEQLDAPAFTSLQSLTVLDPCMGSGHFLREAFDMLVAMYQEQQPELDAAAVADRILAEHLYGIDIDPRAAQLAAFTLYARAWELVRDERRVRRQPGPGSYAPAALNLATTPGRSAPGALSRHLQRHPGDRPLEPLLAGVFAALENADILGSLLRPREHLAAAIAELRRPRQLPMQADPDLQVVQDAVEEVLRTDPSRLEEMLLERVASSFAADARGTDDVAAALFGRAAERGVWLLQLLDRQYAVVVTNPPYMGSKNMDAPLRGYVERHYTPGKRDLYAAFILRCLEATRPAGRVAMVTQQSWMFLGSFADLRAVPDEELPKANAQGAFTGVLRKATVLALAHLGRYAFSEIGNALVAPVLFIAQAQRSTIDHSLWACRLTAPRPSDQQATLLHSAVTGRAPELVSRPLQADFLQIPDAPMVYWLKRSFFSLMKAANRLQQYALFAEPSTTGDSIRFMRQSWEAQQGSRWILIARGGGYAKWYGLQGWSLRWDASGAALKSFPGSYIRNEELMFLPGITYSEAASGKLAARLLGEGESFGKSSPGVIPASAFRDIVFATLNSRVSSYLMRILARGFLVSLGTVSKLPLPPYQGSMDCWGLIVSTCVSLKRALLSSVVTESSFCMCDAASERLRSNESEAMQAVLHAVEGLNERLVCDAYGLGEGDVAAIMAETGTPGGWYSLIDGYDTLPPLPDVLTLPDDLCERLGTHLASQGVALRSQVAALKARIRSLYEAGPGAAIVDGDTDDLAAGEDEGENTVAGAYLPIPAETFLEELSQKLQIHPISVYWLLQEIRAEGARCKPEEKRLLEDRLSVIVLRLLGHRWPKQIEAGEPVPEWADSDGIIPLQAGSGEALLAERVRERLRAEDGGLGAQQAEALLAELTGRSLEEWLRRDFFARHVRQFKYRPIAWHLASTPQSAGASGTKGRSRGGARSSNPAFECLVYYHAAGVGLLARIRTQYVEPLLHAERGRESAARQTGDDTIAAQANARVRELEAFTERLRQVEEQGFACAELDALIGPEPLDRWSGDGILPPSSHEALLAQEQAWMVDINDGVRVNLAPVQLAGVLAANVLKEPDARKAIADRARWRADERRWVREGVLPRCGWMTGGSHPDIPESPRWTERAPEREAERARLEAKRAEALRKLEGATDATPAVKTAWQGHGD